MIVGITGLKRSGKDTIANQLVRDWHFTKYSLAQPIKDIVREVFLLDGDDEQGKEDILPEWGVSKRQLWQYVGTNLFRDVLPILLPELGKKVEKRIWIYRFILWYKKNEEVFPDIVIPDVRFINEYEELKKAFGDTFLLVKVVGGKSVEGSDSHPSETEIQHLVPDILIENKSTLKKLEASVETLSAELFHKDK
jgi:hypothetical protein